MILLLAAAALAQSTTPRPPRPVIVTPAPMDNARALGALSPRGQAQMKAQMAAERAFVEAAASRLRAAQLRALGATRRRPLDVAALRTAMEARDRLQFELTQARTRRAIAFLERLSPADRSIVARALSGQSDRPAPSARPVPRS